VRCRPVDPSCAVCAGYGKEGSSAGAAGGGARYGSGGRGWNAWVGTGHFAEGSGACGSASGGQLERVNLIAALGASRHAVR
jgi:hypothetical protein